MTRVCRRWTAGEDVIVRSFMADGVPLEQIAASLDRTTASVNSRASVLGLPRRRPIRRWAEWEDALVRRAASDNLRLGRRSPGQGRFAEVARQIGRTRHAVNSRAFRLGAASLKARRTKARKAVAPETVR